MFDKTKKFIKEHPAEIAVVAAAAVGCVVGIYCGRKIEVKWITSDPAMKACLEVLDDIPGNTRIRVFRGIYPAGLNPKELGELGEKMITEGADALNDAFTHFIAIKKIDA